MKTVKRVRAEAHAELAPLMTGDFLQALFMAARVLGYASDPFEVMSFVQECYDVAGKEAPLFPAFEPFYDLYDKEEN